MKVFREFESHRFRQIMKGFFMANYGRGWNDGYGSQSQESIEEYWDEEAKREGDWEWLEKSPRQKRLKEQEESK